MSNKLFDSYTWKFNQTGLAEKRTKEYCSKYGNGQATTHDPTVRAILYYATAMRDFSVAAIGTYGTNNVVEVHDAGRTKVAIYSTATKRFLACDLTNGVPTSYKLGKNGEDGSELLFAMMPTLLEDSEFEENYKLIEDICNTQRDTETTIKEIESDENAINALLVLCDNVYRRVNNDNLCIISNTGNITPISELAISQGVYAPTDIIAGSFTALTASSAPAEKVDSKSFSSDYALNSARVFTESEQSLIPTLPEWYIVPKYLVSACKMVTSELSRSVRNILLRVILPFSECF